MNDLTDFSVLSICFKTLIISAQLSVQILAYNRGLDPYFGGCRLG